MSSITIEDRAATTARIDYDPAAIESRWQRQWAESGQYSTPEPTPDHPKWYALTMFPYTSGDLHIGHWYAMAPSDALARFRRMQGYSVFYPMGFDSFGLNGENAAIKHGIHPAEWTRANIARMRGQLQRMGAMYDWSREFATCDPEYYRWTQWLFKRLHQHGLAYRAEAPANWCPSCNTVLANEQVIDGLCERCDTPVERRNRWQWLLRISRYAERLLDYSAIEWPAEVQARQRAWIGRSRGARIRFAIEGSAETVEVFTTRPDTLFGVTFMVLAPEHQLIDMITTPDQRAVVAAYRQETRRFSDVERQQTEHTASGVFTGAYARHPITGAAVPIWIADYVLPNYGSGAIMAVPAHDRRDYRFARRFDLPVITVVSGDPAGDDEIYSGEGPLLNSAQYDGLAGEAARAAIIAALAATGAGEEAITYRLRDWLVSRQRYWGAPIPIIHCPQCGEVDVPDAELPVRLPEIVDFRPTGESPLASVPEFVNTSCPNCGGPARRDTDTLDTFVDSAWYYLRYVSPHYEDGPFDPAEGQRWLPVDQYSGGVDHATAHLIYVRFFGLAMFDMGITPVEEPLRRLHANGLITVDNRKMSKSRGHMIVPEKYVQEYGADAFRAYLMFIGPWKDGAEWSDSGLVGVRRWLNRVWRMVLAPREGADVTPATLRQATAAAITNATADLEQYKVNTYIAGLMEFSNTLARAAAGPEREAARDTLLLLLAPAAPHLAEELWQRSGHSGSVHAQPWPVAVEEKAEHITIPVQIDGRVRDRITVDFAASDAEVEQAARVAAKAGPYLAGGQWKVVYVRGRLISFTTQHD